MKNKKFNSAKITIKIGQTVKWINEDEHDHKVIADDGSFKSENISSGEEYTYTFKKAGKFSYTCTYHPRMKGTVMVED
jgi:plastocyanin